MRRLVVQYLCSHLIQIVRPGVSGVDTTALLEEICETEAVLSVGSAVARGERIALVTEGYLAWAEVTACERSEEGYAVRCVFDPAFRWDPGQWRPDHLYNPALRRKSAGASSG